jgi:hypothetical protein
LLESSDIVAITQVVNLYGHVLDARDWDRLTEVFTDDGVFDLSDVVIPGAGSPVHEGLPAIRRRPGAGLVEVLHASIGRVDVERRGLRRCRRPHG